MTLDLSQFTIAVGEHYEKSVIWIQFEKNNALIALLRQEVAVRWSASQKAWYASDNRHNRELLGLEQKSIGKMALSKISEVNLPALQMLEDELKLKGYSPNTLRTYMMEFAQLLYVLDKYPVNTLTTDHIRAYFLYCINTLKLSENHLHSRLNAIKFYFEKVLKKEYITVEIPRPKKPLLLPKVIDRRDIKKMFSVIENPKHRLMMQLCYGMGLRVSEVVQMKVEDIDSGRMMVHIRQSKGKKDRYVPLPESILYDLREYYKAYRPQNYLFEGQQGGQYSKRSVQAVFKNAMQKAKVNKKVGVHGLRHSYATHLIEGGTDIRFVQDLLGHNSIKTTEIYTHISDIATSKIKSPLDFME